MLAGPEDEYHDVFVLGAALLVTTVLSVTSGTAASAGSVPVVDVRSSTRSSVLIPQAATVSAATQPTHELVNRSQKHDI